MAEASEQVSNETTLYEEFRAERDEILRHKWLLSEEAGQDVGFEHALVDWSINRRMEWKKEYLKKSRS